MKKGSDRPPTIVMGGGSNAVSIARALGRRGIRVYALNTPDALVRHSRYCSWIDVSGRGEVEERWSQHLLGPEMESLRGSVLLAASDAGLMVLAQNRAALAARYILDLSEPAAQLSMLDKLQTYRIAREAQVPTPGFLEVKSWAEALAHRSELVFPLLVKPRASHLFEARFGQKFFIARNMGELQDLIRLAENAQLDVILMELVPGPDSLLCSYYTYIDERGEALFDFTKRVIRRYPVGMGGGCYHVTDHVPEIREHALKLFRHAGVRGLANAEFKQDTRTGQLKLIECNARFTAANGLVAESGVDLAYFVYARAVGLPLPPMDSFQSGTRLWDPMADVFAFRALRASGDLTLAGWLASILYRQTFPYFLWSDPLPGIAGLGRELARIVRSRRHRLVSRIRKGLARTESAGNGDDRHRIVW